MPERYREDSSTLAASSNNMDYCIKWDATTKYTGSNDPGDCEVTTIRSMTDVVTPLFEKKRANGEIINNDMSKEVITNSDESCNVDMDIEIQPSFRDTKVQYFSSSGSFPVEPLLRRGFNWANDYYGEGSLMSVGSLGDLSLQRAHANVGASPTQGLVTAAEMKKSIQSVSTALKAALHFIRGASRVKKKMLTGLLRPREASNTYLQIRYGLRPIFYDVMNVLESIEAHGKASRMRYSGFAEDTVTTVDDTQEIGCTGHSHSGGSIVIFNDPEAPVGDNGAYQLEISTIKSVLASSGVLSEAKVPTNGLSDVIGTGELLQSTWELVPFSFIVDWFFTIGTTIAAWAPKVDRTQLASWTTITQKTVVVYRVVGWEGVGIYNSWWESSSDTTVNACEGRYTVTKEVTTRTADPSLSAIPSLDIRLNVAKIADLAAIIYLYK